MDKTTKVKLRNDYIASLFEVQETYFALETLLKSDPYNLFRFYTHCQTDEIVYLGLRKEIFRVIGLLSPWGAATELAKNVALSSVIVEGTEISLVSPIQEYVTE